MIDVMITCVHVLTLSDHWSVCLTQAVACNLLQWPSVHSPPSPEVSWSGQQSVSSLCMTALLPYCSCYCSWSWSYGPGDRKGSVVGWRNCVLLLQVCFHAAWPLASAPWWDLARVLWPLQPPAYGRHWRPGWWYGAWLAQLVKRRRGQ